MSIASRIQEIETHIGDVYDTINYSYDTTGINKNIINIPKYLKKGYIDIINNGIDTLYNNFPKVSGIGSNLSLTPTYEAPIKLNEIDGDTLQDGTPTPDTPVPIQSVTGLQNVNVCGKNLLPINQIQSQTINGLTITNLEDGTIKVNGTANTTTRLDVTYTKPLKANTPYIFSNANIRASSNANINIQDSDNNVLGIITLNVATNTYTPTTDVTIAKMRFYIDSGQSFDNYILKVQLEQGSATSYEPYKGNTYEVNLGKNIWSVGNKNVSWATNYVDVKNILNTLSEGTYSITLNFKVTEIVKEKTNNLYGFTFHNSNGHIYNKKNTNSNINVNDNFVYTYTFTISSSQVGNFTNAYFYGFGNDTDDVTAKSLMYDCQLEKGSTSTSYSPYFTPIELNKIGDYKDSIKKSTGKNLFDIESFVQNNSDYYTLSDNKLTCIQTDGRSSGFTYFQKFTAGTYTISTENNCNIRVFIEGSSIATINDAKKLTFTIGADANLHFKFFGNNLPLLIGNVQIEKGTQATSYEPYGKVWYVKKQIGKVVLNGSEKWFDWSNNRMVLATLTDYKKVDSSTTSLLMSNYYKAVSRANSQTNNSMCFYGNSDDSFGIIVCDGTNNTSTLLKAWLSTHNTEVLYVLATPTYTEITNTELIEDLETLYTAKSQDGTTNISITSEDLEMILNVSALKGDA